MEAFKIENYRAEYPNKDFPWFRSLPKEELAEVTTKMFKLLKVSDSNDLIELVDKIINEGVYLDDFNAENDTFSLASVLHFLEVTPLQKVFVNWYRFDDIDEMDFDSLNSYFDDIWYSGPDDIDIFDKSFSWIISISHDGAVIYNDLKNKGGQTR